jgi:Domain of unknown function (DUF4190)
MTAADDTPQWRAQQTNPLAIASMVCGMVALVLGPLAILAIVSGHIARRHVRRTGEGGCGMATAGLILGVPGPRRRHRAHRRVPGVFT